MKLDSHSESLLAQVHPVLAARGRLVAADVQSQIGDNQFRWISGLRTYDEQNKLFTKKPPVTKARGGYSNHNFGLALDGGIFDKNGKYLQNSPLYNLIQGAAHRAKLESGMDWVHFKDLPHVQLPSDLIVKGSPTNTCRALFAKGGLPAIFAHVTAYLNSAASTGNSATSESNPLDSATTPSEPPTT